MVSHAASSTLHRPNFPSSAYCVLLLLTTRWARHLTGGKECTPRPTRRPSRSRWARPPGPRRRPQTAAPPTAAPPTAAPPTAALPPLTTVMARARPLILSISTSPERARARHRTAHTVAATFYNYASCYSNRSANSYTVLCGSVRRFLFAHDGTIFVAVSPLSLSQLLLQQCSAWSWRYPRRTPWRCPRT